MNPKLKALFQLAGALAGSIGLISRLREARADKDRLALADAVISALGMITGAALAVRTLRKGDDPK